MNEELQKFIVDDTRYETKLTKKFLVRKRYQPQNPKLVYAFIPGTIREVFVKPGQSVAPGDDLLILEAMKMKNYIKSAIKGVIDGIHVVAGQNVAKNELLIEYE